MATWNDLDRELDAWLNRGRIATLWWRDDDATEVTPALERLLSAGVNHHIPVAIAVVPQGMTVDLCRQLERVPGCAVLQHGYSHANHAPTGEKKAELGAHRPPAEALAELAEGMTRMRAETRLFPALVPPWNRIDSRLLAGLPSIGFAGLSTFGPRPARRTAEGLVRANTHVDPVAWHDGRGFLGEEAVLDQLVGHLRDRREGRVDADEPTGFLTHHLVCDEPGWKFLDALFDATGNHKAVKWLTAEEAFGQ